MRPKSYLDTLIIPEYIKTIFLYLNFILYEKRSTINATFGYSIPTSLKNNVESCHRANKESKIMWRMGYKSEVFLCLLHLKNRTVVFYTTKLVLLTIASHTCCSRDIMGKNV